MGVPAAHPCGLVNKTCIQNLKLLYKSGKSTEFTKAVSTFLSKTPKKYTPKAICNVEIEAYGAGVGHKEFTLDAEQSVQQAVAFCMTCDPVYAKNAIAILHAWSTICTRFEGSNAPLELGWGCASMARCAEILKHTCPTEWNSSGIEKELVLFFDKIALPKLKKTLTWTNNWQTTICEARLQIAIFRDDKAEVEWAINEYKRILASYVDQTGKTQETLRDLVHAQFGIGSLIQIPELMFVYTNGAVDLFQPVLRTMCEFHAQLLLGKIPIGCDIAKDQIKDAWFLPCGWEIALYHFKHRMKLDMPYTDALLQKHRPEQYVFHWGLGTLTHYHGLADLANVGIRA